jgi:hypothetical protein
MYTVYWTETTCIDGINTDQCKMKQIETLTASLTECESLRRLRKAGAPLRAITMVSENPNSVGQAGVDVTNADYDWKKRRV